MYFAHAFWAAWKAGALTGTPLTVIEALVPLDPDAAATATCRVREVGDAVGADAAGELDAIVLACGGGLPSRFRTRGAAGGEQQGGGDRERGG